MNKDFSTQKLEQVDELHQELVSNFIKFIQARVGILVKHKEKDLVKAIYAGCKRFNLTPEEYLSRLEEAEDNSDLISHLVSVVTIGETYFFRDKHQSNTLYNAILPTIIKNKIQRGEKSLRIWSAGCSSGEEIYSIVMMLKEIVPSLDEWQCHFLATDININSLKNGIAGHYHKWAMRAIPGHYLAKYFTKTDNQYDLHDDIKNRVRFEYLNLISGSYPSLLNGTTMFDLIICRNVLIYFENADVKSILKRLEKSICEDGFIVLGASDPIGLFDSEIMSVPGMSSIYRRRSTDNTSDMITPAKVERDAVLSIKIEKIHPDRDADSESEIKSDNTVDLTALSDQSKWSEVIEHVNHEIALGKCSAKLLSTKALALANVGMTHEAIRSCEESINLDKMNKEVYFTYALLLAEVGRIKEAEVSFRKALYIDKNYLFCRYQFGLFLIHMNRRDEGIKSLESAIFSASQCNLSDIVPHSHNLSYEQLIIILKNEVALHQH